MAKGSKGTGKKAAPKKPVTKNDSEGANKPVVKEADTEAQAAENTEQPVIAESGTEIEAQTPADTIKKKGKYRYKGIRMRLELPTGEKVVLKDGQEYELEETGGVQKLLNNKSLEKIK